MARLGRSIVESFLRKPTVVAASITFRAIVTRLVAVKTGTEQVRHSLEGVNVGHGSPNYALRPPIAVAASVTFRPVQERLAQTPRAYVRTSSKLRAPTVVAAQVAPFVASSIKVKLGQPARSNFHTVSRLQRPTVVAPSVTYAPVAVRTARAVLLPAQRSRPVLRPPATLQAAAAAGFVAAPISTKLTRTPSRAFHVSSRLRAPSTVAPSVAFKTFAPKLVQPPRAAFRFTSRLRPPAVVAPSVTFGPLVTKLAPSARQARKQHSRLLPVPFFASPTKTRLTVAFAPSPTQGRRTSYRLDRIPIVGAATVFTFLTGFFDPSSFTPGQTNPSAADFDPETHNADAPNATVNDFDPPNPR